MAQTTYVSSGMSFGSALAIVISWSQWQSILWAMFHGIFGWIYVIYYAITSGAINSPVNQHVSSFVAPIIL